MAIARWGVAGWRSDDSSQLITSQTRLHPPPHPPPLRPGPGPGMLAKLPLRKVVGSNHPVVRWRLVRLCK